MFSQGYSTTSAVKLSALSCGTLGPSSGYMSSSSGFSSSMSLSPPSLVVLAVSSATLHPLPAPRLRQLRPTILVLSRRTFLRFRFLRLSLPINRLYPHPPRHQNLVASRARVAPVLARAPSHSRRSRNLKEIYPDDDNQHEVLPRLDDLQL